MAYKALYNKYRPSTFEEVAGQQAIVRTLKNAINNGKIAHAYLFCGPRGTGKTSMARLFAKALNCEEGIGHQCNQCSNCQALISGSHPDVIEIDAASNTGVDQVRELIDQVHYAPMKGRYKVYIIDEVHMMSASAFNALLKTLEEPPEHVIFILATTEPHQVLPTILSRCQRYDFAKIEDRDLRSKLIWVMQQEQVTYEEAALDQLVSLADGGMRDALSILDQVLAYGGNHLKEEDILSMFGLTSEIEKVELLRQISANNVADVLDRFERFLNAGVDIKRLALNLMDILKDVVLYGKTKSATILTAIHEEKAKLLVDRIDIKQASKMIDILMKAQSDFKVVSSIRSLFELSLIQLCAVFDGAEIQETPTKPAPKPAEAPIPPKPEPAEETLPKPASFNPEPVQEPKPEPVPTPAPKPTPAPTPKPAPEPKKPAQPELGVYDPESNRPYTGTVPPSFLLEPEEIKPEAPTPTPKPLEQPAPKPKPAAPSPKPVETPAPTPVPKPAEAPVPEPPAVEPIDVTGLEHPTLALDGTPLTLNDDEIIKMMVLGRKWKEQRQELVRAWARLGSLKLNKKFGDLASLLVEAHPMCLCEEALLILFNFTHLRDKANLEENQRGISELVGKLLGRKVFVYALDLNDSNRCRYRHASLKQLDKLPKIDEITLNLPKGDF